MDRFTTLLYKATLKHKKLPHSLFSIYLEDVDKVALPRVILKPLFYWRKQDPSAKGFPLPLSVQH